MARLRFRTLMLLLALTLFTGCGGGGSSGGGGPVDDDPPIVALYSPASGAVGVPVGGPFSVTFSEEMDPATLTQAAVYITGPSGAVAATLTFDGLTVELTLAAPLEYGQSYTFNVTTDATDLAGNPLFAPVSFTFTTEAAPDTTPPTVTGRTPAQDAAGVAVASTVTATFSEALDPATVTETSFTLTGPSGAVAGTVGYAGTTATFTPTSPLAYAAEYTATLTVALEDLAGNPLEAPASWTFTTADPPDTTPPTVTGRTPAPDAAGVAISSAVTATFSEALDPATVTGTSFTLTGPSGAVAGTVDYAGTTATFTPSSPLANAAEYTATLTTALKDLAGNTLAAPVVWTFTTADPPDTTPPTVTGRTPAPDAAGVAIASAITTTFSEALDPATVTETSFTLTGPSGAVAGTVGYAGTTATFTPAAPLAYATEYTATLTVALEDLVGNPLATEAIWTFRTGPDPSDVTGPTLIAMSPAPGAFNVDPGTVITLTFSEPLDPESVYEGIVDIMQGDPVYRSFEAITTLDGATITVTPTAPLPDSTRFDVDISEYLFDLAGNQLQHSVDYSFCTGMDTYPPKIVVYATQYGVLRHVDATIEIVFDEPLLPSSVNDETVQLMREDDTPVACSVALDGRTITLIPEQTLEYSTRYYIHIGSVSDLSSNLFDGRTWGFLTEPPPDLTPPEVSASYPGDGATEVPVQTALFAWFSEALTLGTVTETSFTLDGPNGPVSGSVAYDGETAFFVPDEQLLPATTYAATLSTVVADRAGNHLAAPHTFTFTTAAANDETAPTVTLLSPAADAERVDVITQIKATFSEEMDAASFDGATFTLTGPEGEIAGAVTYSALTATFTPAAALACSTAYTATVTAGAADLAGNPLETPVSWTFTTEAPSTKKAIVSVGPGGVLGNKDSRYPVVSKDGRYVAFISRADNLVRVDTNGSSDVFLTDRSTGETRLVSLNSDGAQEEAGWLEPPSVSDDGRYVVITSMADMDKETPWPTDGDYWLSIFLRDTLLGTTREIPIPLGESPAPHSSFYGAISGDGSRIAYNSSESDLVEYDTNGNYDVFLYDMDLDTTEMVSVSTGGEQGNSPWYGETSISADGSRISFQADGSNLVPDDSNGMVDIFVRDVDEGWTARVSVSTGGIEANGRSFSQMISANGRFVVFDSYATNLVPDDTNGTSDIFLHDLETETTTRVNMGVGGEETDSESTSPSISADGRYVFFYSYASNLLPDFNGGADAYYMLDRNTGELTYLYKDNTYNHPAVVSADGRWVVYYSYGSEGVPGADLNGVPDIFIIGPLH